MKIVIPTYKRATLEQQHTAKEIPASLRGRVFLVVRQEEAEDYGSIADELGVATHVLPEGSHGIAMARKQIAEWLQGERYWVLDDDLVFRNITWVDGVANVSRRADGPLPEDVFMAGYRDISRLLDEGFMFGSCPNHSTPPDPRGYDVCGRVWTNVFYHEDLPVDQLDWAEHEPIMPEDFHVTLQLFKMGHANVITHNFRVDTSKGSTGADGGCSDYRTVESHNQGSRKLAEMHPEFVKTYTKVQKSGGMVGEKLGLRIQWKKCFEASGRNLPSRPSPLVRR